jgi:hypothetical protein
MQADIAVQWLDLCTIRGAEISFRKPATLTEALIDLSLPPRRFLGQSVSYCHTSLRTLIIS